MKPLGKLLSAVSAVRLLDDAMPLQQFAVFLTVARNDGLTLSDIGEKLHISSSSASRNVQALSDYHWIKPRKGLELVETTIDRMDTRKKVVTLTKKGERLADELVSILGGGLA